MLGDWGAEGCSHLPPGPQVEALLPPIQGGLAHLQLPAPPPHHPDGGPPLPLRQVDPPHFIHLPFQRFSEISREVELEVGEGLLVAPPPMYLR